MFTHPGTKLLFQGCEFGQSEEWDFEKSLDWHLLEYDSHKGMKELVKALNEFYKSQPALYEKQFVPEGFEWIDYSDAENSVISFIRKGDQPKDNLIIVCNLTQFREKTTKLACLKPVNSKKFSIAMKRNSTEQEITRIQKRHLRTKPGIPGNIQQL